MELHTEERKKMLEQTGVSEEVIRFLSGLEPPLLYEWSFLCAMEGMPLEDLERIRSEADKQRAQASELFMKAREEFLKKTYENNRDLWKEVRDLLAQVKTMYERTHALEEEVGRKMTEAMQIKDKAFGETMQAKDLLIRDRDKQLTALREDLSDLKKENAGLREENRSLLEKNAGLKEKVYSLEERLRTAENQLSSAVKENINTDSEERKNNRSPEEMTASSVAERESMSKTDHEQDEDRIRVFPYSRYGYPMKQSRSWSGFFNRKDREADKFIRLYMDNKEFSDAQKKYLIKCLEQGDSLTMIRKFAIPGISVSYMDQLRQVFYERGY
ncbi:MAG: hypothetical protein IJH64_05235 [Oscillospiraceae bacterium]|nr:hypothetical protein [Oscillospiraceae bacterium]